MFLFIIVHILNAYPQSIDSYWTLVFAGKNITHPVFWNGCIYAAGDDKALNCITSQGKFLWRRNTKEYPSEFLSISNSGILFLITAKGNVEAVLSQGIPLWTYKLDKKPIFPIYPARDGRIFIVQSNFITCITSTGKLKWKLSLPSHPIQPPAETGSKDIILLLNSGDIVRISIFGKIVEQYHLKKTVSAIGEAPNGYILACTDGSISYYKTTCGSEANWQVIENEICKNIFYKSGNVLYMFESGRVLLKTLKDNKLLWDIQTKGNFSQEVKCYAMGNEFNITSKGFGCLITDSGRLKWEKIIPENNFLPLITENGLLVGITNEVLNAYRVETKLLRYTSKQIINFENFYSIVKEDSNGKSYIPFFIEYATAKELLEIIKKDIEIGTVGEKEPRYALQLKIILEDKRKASYFSQNFTSYDRYQAAELLGRLGSYEYADILLDCIPNVDDLYVLTGILRGLEHLAFDGNGKTLRMVEYIMRKAHHDDLGIMMAACDCLTALAKYGDIETAASSITMLFSVIKGPYSNIIQDYARQKIKNIVK